MKKVALVIAVTLAAFSVNAQSGRFSAGLELGLPMGDAGDVYGLGFGGTLRYEYGIADKIGLTGTAGYQSFKAKDVDFSLSIIPIQIGGKYYFNESWSGLYASVEVGAHISSVSDCDECESSTDIGFAPGLGYMVGENIDLGLRYQLIPQEGTSFDYIGVRAAYVFGGK